MTTYFSIANISNWCSPRDPGDVINITFAYNTHKVHWM